MMLDSSKMRMVLLAGLSTVFLTFFAGTCRAQEEAPGAETVSCSDTRISVNARDMKAEDLMKEIGERCGIKMVVVGEVFSADTVSMQFQSMPIRKGVERVLRAINIANHLMHFEDTDNGTRIVEIDLIGKKGGEKELTKGMITRSNPKPTPREAKMEAAKRRRAAKRDLKGAVQEDRQQEQKIQENFLNVMDQILKTQLEDGEEPDPAEVLKMFKDVVPEDMMEHIPPEVLEELERLER